jgi:hypothetical protein
MDFTIGSDPEFILKDQKNNIKSAIGVIKGTRNKRLKINQIDFYYDNVLAECTVKPSKNKEEFVLNVKKSIEIFKELVKPYKITTLSSAHFSSEELLHKDARKSGCAVEYCAYNLEAISPRKIDKIFSATKLRTAGGHVHLGTDLGKKHESCVMLVRMLDLFLGFTFLFLDDSKESIERRKIYGAAGRYRQPKYGVEYRTLGNYWLSSPKLVELVYDICEFTINFTQENRYENFWRVDNEKLNSDEFWNNGGDPSKCHECYGYDINKFKNLFFITGQNLIQESKKIKEIVNFYFTDSIKNQINNLRGKELDMDAEWHI